MSSAKGFIWWIIQYLIWTTTSMKFIKKFSTKVRKFDLTTSTNTISSTSTITSLFSKKNKKKAFSALSWPEACNLIWDYLGFTSAICRLKFRANKTTRSNWDSLTKILKLITWRRCFLKRRKSRETFKSLTLTTTFTFSTSKKESTKLLCKSYLTEVVTRCSFLTRNSSALVSGTSSRIIN